MAFKIGDGSSVVQKLQETIKKPEIQKPILQPPDNQGAASKFGENNFHANNLRSSLNKTVDTQLANSAATTGGSVPTPSAALDQINQLPVPSLNDPVATRSYQQQRAAIADSALQSATPPTLADFEGLPPRLAEMEYRDALNSYNSDVSTLRGISAAANADLQTSPTAALDESAQRVWEAAQNGPQEGARVLAQEVEALNTRFGPEAGGQLLGKLYQDSKVDSYEHDLSNILSFAGGAEYGSQAGLPEAQRNAIGVAIGQAYDAMPTADRQEFVNNLVYATDANSTRGFAVGYDPNRIADLISRGDSASFKTDMVNALTERMVEIQPGWGGLNNGGANIQALANSAAMIAGGGANSAEQVAMFNTIIKSLPEVNGDQLKSLMDDPALKDRLSQIFLDNSTEIVQSLTNEDGRFLDTDSIDGLKTFFEMTMFSKNPGELRQQTMAEGVALVSRFADPTASATSGRDKPADAYTAGSLTAVFQSAANSQKQNILDDQETRAETTKMFVGLAFSFAPGASDILGEGANKGLEFIYGQATEYAEENANTALGGLINSLEADALKNTDEGFNVFRELAITIPSQVLNGRDELADAFDLGYSKASSDLLNAAANN